MDGRIPAARKRAPNRRLVYCAPRSEWCTLPASLGVHPAPWRPDLPGPVRRPNPRGPKPRRGEEIVHYLPRRKINFSRCPPPPARGPVPQHGTSLLVASPSVPSISLVLLAFPRDGLEATAASRLWGKRQVVAWP